MAFETLISGGLKVGFRFLLSRNNLSPLLLRRGIKGSKVKIIKSLAAHPLLRVDFKDIYSEIMFC